MNRENLSWWTDHLTPPPAESSLPLFRPRSKVYSPKRTSIRLLIPTDLLAVAARFSGGDQGAMAGLVLAAIAGVLYRYTGNERIAVGSALPPTDGKPAAVTVLVAIHPEASFTTLVEHVHATLREAYDRHVPISEVITALGLHDVQNRNPLFAVALHIPSVQTALPDNLRNDVTVVFHGDSLEFDSNARLLEPETVERFARHLLHLLAAGLATPEGPLRAIDYLDFDERSLLARWNCGPTSLAPEKTVQGLFEEQVARTPDGEALCFEGKSLTFDEINRRANRLAHLLCGQGVETGTCVGLCLPASADLLIALVGILKSGAGVMPIVPTFPATRNSLMIEDARLRWIVTRSDFRSHLSENNQGHLLCLDELAEELALWPDENPPGGAQSGDLIYVLFTSGSTGRPKGVQMEQRSLVNLLLWQRDRGQDPAGRRTLQRTSIGFDVSFQEIFSTWCFGGSLVVAPDAAREDVSLLPSLIDQHRIERIFIPPVALQQLAVAAIAQKCSLASLAEIVVAGEQLQITMAVIRLFREIQCTLDNQYGPTETHVVTAYELLGPSTRWPALPPVGRPIRNAQVYVLDPWLQPVPPGIPGEIVVGGTPVARGYIKREEPTGQSFLTDPFSLSGEGRLYRTGDVGRFLTDGTIEFLGRRDHQVKIRGYRIELGEIEAVLHELPGIRQAAVAVHEDQARGKQLAAYVVGQESGRPTVATIHSFLLQRLPRHMVPSPSMILHLDALPLTPTGKVDRKSLVAATDARPKASMGDLVASRSDTERQISTIWAKILGFEGIGPNESFLDLGGHSLLGIQILSQISEIYNVRLPLSMLMRGATVAQVAEHLDELTGASRNMETAPERHQEPQFVELPNGRRISCLQRSEAAYLYVDIFEHRTYDRVGIHYPSSGLVFDVGANIGLFTLYALERSPGLRVFAFEPAPPVFEALRRNTAGLANVSLFDCALSDHSGKAVLTYYPSLSGMSSFYPDPDQERVLLRTILRNLADLGREDARQVLPYAEELVLDRLLTTTYTCRLCSLSEILAECGGERIDLLKIDVQKAEMDVLRGIGDDDWKKIRQIVVEVHDLDNQVDRVTELLRGRGYCVSVEQDLLHRDTVVHFVYAT